LQSPQLLAFAGQVRPELPGRDRRLQVERLAHADSPCSQHPASDCQNLRHLLFAEPQPMIYR